MWSAVAATFSALTAFVAMRIQRANRLDAARPELVLTGWGLENPNDRGATTYRIHSVRNVGKGPALHLWINAGLDREGRPLVFLPTIRVPILAPGESHQIDAELIVYWKNAKPDHADFRYVHVAVDLVSWDTLSFRHTTTYRLLAVQAPVGGQAFLSGGVAPGLSLGTRTSVVQPTWRLKLAALPQRAWRKAVRRVQAIRRPKPPRLDGSEGDGSS